MLVIADKNDQSDLPDDISKYAFGQDESGRLPLTIGKKYVVSGVRHVMSEDFYLILADDGELKGNPWWHSASLFSVVDAQAPDGWVRGGTEEDSFYTFPELALDQTGEFENNLEDGESVERGIFLGYYREYVSKYEIQ